MKYLILLLVVFVQQALANCDMQSASQLSNDHTVGPITNLIKDKVELGASGRCTVKFDIVVDGRQHHLEETEEGLEQLESLCYYARERARKNLLLDLGGKFTTEAVTVCKEGAAPNHKIKIGDMILENEVGKSRVTKYFNYRNARCRMFQQTLAEGRAMKVYHGVICETDNSGANWIVIDKW